MSKLTKRRKAMLEGFDARKSLTLVDALEAVKRSATAKFDETVELHVKLGVDAKKTDQAVRGTAVLPKGLGKSKRVAVVAKGDKAKDAETAGADVVGDADLIEKIGGGWFEFDVLIATPDTMKDLAKLGKVLGPKGLMPNPKAGTVTFEVGRAVKEVKAGRVEFKLDDSANIHTPVGKASFQAEDLSQNVQTVLNAILAAKPATAKGAYVKSVTVSSTMGLGVRVAHDNLV